ncbi:MAG: glycosyltransferase [Bryobacteraceae bacterium]
MRTRVKIAFASGSEELIPGFLDQIERLYPELEMYVVSEHPPAKGKWIPYHLGWSFRENLERCRATLKDADIQIAAVLLQPQMPFWRMRMIPAVLAPLRTLFYNENLDHFMIRPAAMGSIARHFLWRTKNFVRWQTAPGGGLYTFLWRMKHPSALREPALWDMAALMGKVSLLQKRLAQPRPLPSLGASLPGGISVVIPSRNGKELLERLLPGVVQELNGYESEIIVVDNGSDDGTAAFLAKHYPAVRTEFNERPLSFARAVNRGMRAARYSRTMLLNNDMVLHPGFFAPLLAAFEAVPNLFCATAQIFFPEGQRREETGKAVMPEIPGEGFPVRCDEPLDGETHSYVLYGSGGCSLLDTAKATALGGFDEIYEPAYVEDLDLGVRAWQLGWPTVFVAGSAVTHDHRATTSRYYTDADLKAVLEINYFRFLVRCIQSPGLFRRLWTQSVRRLAHSGTQPDLQALAATRHATQWVNGKMSPTLDEELLLGLTSGAVAVFPGRAAAGRPVVLIAAPYLPFPLAHGGAVRMYNLMRRAAADYDQVLITFADELQAPPAELREICIEVVQVKRVGSHVRPSTPRPDTVEEFDSSAFRAALRQTVAKWRPAVAQLEFTQMAQYASDCAPAPAVLVEHDITLDLYQQLLAQGEDWETRRHWERWVRFETAAWKAVDCVVTMSEKDRAAVTGARRCVALANGVDLERFQVSSQEPEPARLLFIGSFGHLPNVLALDYFLREVWPLLQEIHPVLHIIAGARHQYFQEMHETRVKLHLNQPGIELDGFVSDVRPAYRRASVVIAPLLASAGTNIKIMEAMAMGKAIVSTPGGVNGLTVRPGEELIVAATAQEFAAAILRLSRDPGERRRLEVAARKAAEAKYSWDAIALEQAELYESLRPLTA